MEIPYRRLSHSESGTLVTVGLGLLDGLILIDMAIGNHVPVPGGKS
jgi:hypothetical protein